MQAQTLNLLSYLQDEFNMGLILITHDLGVVARMADRVLVMYAGKAVETGTSQEVFDQPTHPYTQGLIQCIPVPGRTSTDGRLGSIKGMVPALIGDLRGCMFRNRCAYVSEKCHASEIHFNEISSGRAYRCLLEESECAGNLEGKIGNEIVQ